VSAEEFGEEPRAGHGAPAAGFDEPIGVAEPHLCPCQLEGGVVPLGIVQVPVRCPGPHLFDLAGWPALPGRVWRSRVSAVTSRRVV
jgi:hypothetical protein